MYVNPHSRYGKNLKYLQFLRLYLLEVSSFLVRLNLWKIQTFYATKRINSLTHRIQIQISPTFPLSRADLGCFLSFTFQENPILIRISYKHTLVGRFPD